MVDSGLATPMDPHTPTDLIQVAGAIAAAMRLHYLNLVSKFPSIFAWLVLVALMNLALGLLDVTTSAYFWTYVILEPVKVVFSVLAVRELLSLTLQNYPGIRTMARWVMYGGVAVAMAVSLILAGVFWRGTASGRAHSHLVYYVHVFQRSIVFTLAVAIILILLFLSRYPLQLGWNTRVSSAFFSVLFLCEAIQLLIDTFSPYLFNASIDWMETAFISICLIGWAILLKPETQALAAKVRFSTPHEEHLLQQLASLNQMMTRVARR